MKSYIEITDKYIKHNKKRSILTICGVILSVALITAVSLFILSLQDSFIQQEIQDKGSWHVKIEGINEDIYQSIKNNPRVDKIGLYKKLDIIPVSKYKGIQLTAVDKTSAGFLPYRTVQGRFPDRKGEIAIEGWMLNCLGSNVKVGSYIDLKSSGGNTNQYLITGTVQNDMSDQYMGLGKGFICMENVPAEGADAYFTISSKANISKTVEEMKKTYKSKGFEVTSNESLLRLMGESSNQSTNDSLYSIAVFIIAIIVVATAAVIYNSFQISVVERMKQYGLIRAVGATPKQIRKMVLREASIISMIAIPLGLASGIFALFVVYKVFGIISTETFGSMHMVYSWKVIGASCLVGLAAIYTSAFIPAMFASRVSPLTAISSRALINKEKIKRKRGRLAGKVLGINGLMAFKNIKRNRKRFRITVFSITISITLFIVFSAFIGMMGNFQEHPSESDNMEFSMTGHMDKNGINSLSSKIIDDVQKNSMVKGVYPGYQLRLAKGYIDEDKRDLDAVKINKNLYKAEKDGNTTKYALSAAVDVYNSAKLEGSKKYITNGSVDAGSMLKENGVLIVKNEIVMGSGKIYEGPVTKLKKGDTFYVSDDFIKNTSGNSPAGGNKIKLTVMGIVDYEPYNYMTTSKYSLHIIMPDSVFKKLSGRDINGYPIIYSEIMLKDKSQADKFSKFIRDIGDRNGFSVIDNIQQNNAKEGSMLQISILVYGFIIVIALIGAVNIFNTVTTNLLLRSREIASLKALGMTAKDTRNMVLTEGVLYGIYGSVYGAVLGSVLAYMVSSPMRRLISFRWEIPWNTILIASVTAIAVGIISVIGPLKRIKKENIIEMIRAE